MAPESRHRRSIGASQERINAVSSTNQAALRVFDLAQAHVPLVAASSRDHPLPTVSLDGERDVNGDKTGRSALNSHSIRSCGAQSPPAGGVASGDYAVVGTTLQIVGEQLCEALDLKPGSKVLDVAAGNGMASLAAARRWCRVTSTDYVTALLRSGRARAEAEGHPIEFIEADAEDLPFDDGDFDIALSTFGVMFTPNQDRAAGELLRVCKPKGQIGLANWTPEGF